MATSRDRTGSAPWAFAPRAWVTSILATAVLAMGLAGAADAAGAVVYVTDFGFAPSPVTITAGQTVTWVNRGAVPHWVAPGTDYLGGGFVASPKIPPGGRYTATFSTVGTFVYHDALYGFMTGTVFVKRAPAATPKPTAKPTPPPTPKATAKPTARPTAKATPRPTATPDAGASGAGASGAPAASGAGQSAGAGGGPSTGPTGSGTPGQADQSSSGLGGIGTVLLILVILALVVLAFFGGRASRMSGRIPPRDGPPPTTPTSGDAGAGDG